jgi:hypothetical protein
MPPKTRSGTRVNDTSTVEQPAREQVLRTSSPNVNDNVGFGHVEEVSIN